jgi:hypothetical protein
MGVMDRNPYAPPQARTADGSAARDVPDRPREVATAVKLLWASVSLGVLASAVDWPYQTARLPAGILIPVELVGLAIAVWFIRVLGRGRNWVRILFLVAMIMTILGAMASVWSVPLRVRYLEEYTRSATAGSLRGIQFVLHLIALGYLFTAPARQWFKRRTAN